MRLLFSPQDLMASAGWCSSRAVSVIKTNSWLPTSSTIACGCMAAAQLSSKKFCSSNKCAAECSRHLAWWKQSSIACFLSRSIFCPRPRHCFFLLSLFARKNRAALFVDSPNMNTKKTVSAHVVQTKALPCTPSAQPENLVNIRGGAKAAALQENKKRRRSSVLGRLLAVGRASALMND